MARMPKRRASSQLTPQTTDVKEDKTFIDPEEERGDRPPIKKAKIRRGNEIPTNSHLKGIFGKNIFSNMDCTTLDLGLSLKKDKVGESSGIGVEEINENTEDGGIFNKIEKVDLNKIENNRSLKVEEKKDNIEEDNENSIKKESMNNLVVEKEMKGSNYLNKGVKNYKKIAKNNEDETNNEDKTKNRMLINSKDGKYEDSNIKNFNDKNSIFDFKKELVSDIEEDKLSNLNKSFLNSISEVLKKQSNKDLRYIFDQYNKYLSDLNDEGNKFEENKPQ